MNDLISRQDAIKAVHNLYAIFGSEGEWVDRKDVFEAIEHLPSAQPERIKGRWTKAYDGYDGHVKCVQCFKTYDWDTQAQYYNFCPNCGADMRGEKDETN